MSQATDSESGREQAGYCSRGKTLRSSAPCRLVRRHERVCECGRGGRGSPGVSFAKNMYKFPLARPPELFERAPRTVQSQLPASLREFVDTLSSTLHHTPRTPRTPARSPRTSPTASLWFSCPHKAAPNVRPPQSAPRRRPRAPPVRVPAVARIRGRAVRAASFWWL